MKKHIIIEIHLQSQFDFVKPVYDILVKDTNLKFTFSLFDQEFDNIAAYLGEFQISKEFLIKSSMAPQIECDLFISATTWTEFVPAIDIPKVQLLHGLADKNSAFSGRLDLFNSLFLTGPNHQQVFEKVRANNKKLKHIKTYEVGYPKLDEVINNKLDKNQILSGLGLDKNIPTVVYAPTWELTASLHANGLKIIDALASLDVNVLVKLHPMSFRDPKFTFANGGIDWKAILAATEIKHANVKSILDPNANPYLIASDLMITDASGVGLEFMTTNKPLVFIDVPEFFENCGYGGVEDICRVAGELVTDISDLGDVVTENLKDPGKYESQRQEFSSKLLFNPGQAAEKAVEKILELLQNSERSQAAKDSGFKLTVVDDPRPEVREGLTSIIAIALNGLDYTKRCIESIREHTDLPYELIVVDNGSTDGTLQYLQEQDDVILIANSENVGAPFARNQGLEIARGEYVMFFDNDIVATKDWLKILVEHSKNNPDIGLIGPMSNYVSGAQFVPDSSFEKIEDMHAFAEELTKENSGQLLPAHRLILFAMFATRAVVDKIGGMDPLYGKWGFEDDDYCLRALIAGFKLAVAKDVFIYHKGSSTSEAANIDYSKLLEENWENFKQKWGLPRYHSYMQGYPIQAIISQPFDKSKHYCSLTDRRPSLQAHGQSPELANLFGRSQVDKLTPEQKKQFVLLRAAGLCDGNAAEIGSSDNQLSMMIAVRGLNVTRYTNRSEAESVEALKLGFDNVAFKEGALDNFEVLGPVYDTVVLYLEEEQDPAILARALKVARKAIKGSGKIVFVCESNYRTRIEIRRILDNEAGVECDELAPLEYTFGYITDESATDVDLIDEPLEKAESSGKVSVALMIDKDIASHEIGAITGCLNHLFSQTYPDIEVLVCNSSNNDLVKELIGPFRGRIKYIESSKSASDLIKVVIESSGGEFISFITPNDLLLQKSVEIQVRALNTDKSAAAVVTDTVRYLDSMDGISTRWYAKSLFGGKAVQDQLIASQAHTASALFSRSQLLKHDLVNEDMEGDLYYGLWLNFFAKGLKLKAINVPAVLHKMTSYEEQALQESMDLILDLFETGAGSRQRIIEKFVNDHPVSVLSPIKIMAVQKEQLESALYAFRASILIQYKMYAEALKDIAASIKRNPVDTALRADIKELTFFLLMKTIGLNDNSLVHIVIKQALKIDPDNPTARLHMIRLELLKYLETGDINEVKLNKLAEDLFKLHADNKFDPYQFLSYALLAALLGDETTANKMFDKTLSMNIALPVINTAKIMVQQRMLDKKAVQQTGKTDILRRIEDLVREMTLSLVMIVKDEEDNLARCLKSVQGVVDEIIVVDTGSTDKTKEIAGLFNTKIIEREWNNDFSEARNVSIEHATGDWLMFLDADEELVEEDKELLLSLKADPANEGFNFVISSFIGSSAGQDTVSNIAIRMWKNRPEHRFHGTLHEQILDRVAKTGPVKTVNVRINHYGYLQQIVIDKEKSKRNLEIAIKMVEDEPKNTFAHFSLGLEYSRIAEYENAYEHFEKAAELLDNQNAYFAHVLSLNRVKILKCLERYQEALSLVDQEAMKYPDFPDLVYSKALILFDLKNYSEALKALQVLTEMKADLSKYVSQSGLTTYKPFCLYGAIYEMMADRKMAVSWYSKAFKNNPEYMHNTIRLVSILLKSDPPEEVKKYLDKYINFENSILLSELSTVFINLGHPEIALDYLSKAKEIDSNTPNLFVWLGKANLYLQKRDTALEYLSLVKDTSNAYLESRLDIAYCHGLNGDKEKLEKALKEMSSTQQMKPYVTILSLLFEVPGFGNGAKFDEETSKIYWQVLCQLMYMREFDYFEKALTLKQRLSLEDGVFALNLGNLYYDGNFKDLAMGQYMQALNSGYYDSQSLIIVGDECMSQELYDEAANLYLSAAKMEPPSLGAYIKLVQLFIKQGKYTEAEEVLRECNNVFPENDLVKQTLATLQNIFLKT